MAEEEAAERERGTRGETAALRKRFNDLNAALRDSAESPLDASASFCQEFCQILVEYGGQWKSEEDPLPLLEMYTVAILCFAEATPSLFPECEHVTVVLEKLALTCLDLLLSHSEKVPGALWEDFQSSVKVAHGILGANGNFQLSTLMVLAEESGVWNNATLCSLLSNSMPDAEKVREFLTREGPTLLDMRIKHLIKQKCVEKAAVLAKTCAEFPEFGGKKNFKQIYLVCLCETMPQLELMQEIKEMDCKDALEMICNLESEENEKGALSLCTAFLKRQLLQGDVYCAWELTLFWSKLLIRLESTQAFLDQCRLLAQLSGSVYHILLLIKVIQAEVQNEGLPVCIEMCIQALKMGVSGTEDCSTTICKTISCLLPLDLEVKRACQLTEFLAKPTVDSYYAVETLFNEPDQKIEEESLPIPNSLRCDLLLALKTQWPFDPEFWDWKTLKRHCLALMGEEASIVSSIDKLNDSEDNEGLLDSEDRDFKHLDFLLGPTDEFRDIEAERKKKRDMKKLRERGFVSARFRNWQAYMQYCVLCDKEFLGHRIVKHALKHVQDAESSVTHDQSPAKDPSVAHSDEKTQTPETACVKQSGVDGAAQFHLVSCYIKLEPIRIKYDDPIFLNALRSSDSVAQSLFQDKKLFSFTWKPHKSPQKTSDLQGQVKPNAGAESEAQNTLANGEDGLIHACPFETCTRRYSTTKSLSRHVKNVHFDAFEEWKLSRKYKRIAEIAAKKSDHKNASFQTPKKKIKPSNMAKPQQYPETSQVKFPDSVTTDHFSPPPGTINAQSLGAKLCPKFENSQSEAPLTQPALMQSQMSHSWTSNSFDGYNSDYSLQNHFPSMIIPDSLQNYPLYVPNTDLLSEREMDFTSLTDDGNTHTTVNTDSHSSVLNEASKYVSSSLRVLHALNGDQTCEMAQGSSSEDLGYMEMRQNHHNVIPPSVSDLHASVSEQNFSPYFSSYPAETCPSSVQPLEKTDKEFTVNNTDPLFSSDMKNIVGLALPSPVCKEEPESFSVSSVDTAALQNEQNPELLAQEMSPVPTEGISPEDMSVTGVDESKKAKKIRSSKRTKWPAIIKDGKVICCRCYREFSSTKSLGGHLSKRSQCRPIDEVDLTADLPTSFLDFLNDPDISTIQTSLTRNDVHGQHSESDVLNSDNFAEMHSPHYNVQNGDLSSADSFKMTFMAPPGQSGSSSNRPSLTDLTAGPDTGTERSSEAEMLPTHFGEDGVEVGTFQCDQSKCPAYFTCHLKYIDHIKNDHKAIRVSADGDFESVDLTFKCECEGCDRVYTTKSNLLRHLMKKHHATFEAIKQKQKNGEGENGPTKTVSANPNNGKENIASNKIKLKKKMAKKKEEKGRNHWTSFGKPSLKSLEEASAMCTGKFPLQYPCMIVGCDAVLSAERHIFNHYTTHGLTERYIEDQRSHFIFCKKMSRLRLKDINKTDDASTVTAEAEKAEPEEKTEENSSIRSQDPEPPKPEQPANENSSAVAVPQVKRKRGRPRKAEQMLKFNPERKQSLRNSAININRVAKLSRLTSKTAARQEAYAEGGVAQKLFSPSGLEASILKLFEESPSRNTFKRKMSENARSGMPLKRQQLIRQRNARVGYKYSAVHKKRNIVHFRNPLKLESVNNVKIVVDESLSDGADRLLKQLQDMRPMVILKKWLCS
ncbi:hypothetical protein SRHO_G00136800 [Serrasalmus rhombeus]